MDPAPLGLIRIFTGSMLFYTHLVWSLEFEAFFSPQGALPEEYVQTLYANSAFAWSHFFWIHDVSALWAIHALALLCFACFALGLFTRV
nr:HTTM domain-containing protein [Burkholderiales bacterium]